MNITTAASPDLPHDCKVFMEGLGRLESRLTQIASGTLRLPVAGGFDPSQLIMSATSGGKGSGGILEILKDAKELAEFLNILFLSPLKNADRILATAGAIGMPAESLQALRFGAAERGVDRQDLDRGLQTLFERMIEAAGRDGKLAGVNVKDEETGELRDTLDVLREIAGALAAIPPERRLERLSLASQAFDSDAGTLVDLIGGGAAGLDAMGERARKFDAVIEQSVLEQLAAADRSVATLVQQVVAYHSILLNMTGVANRVREGAVDTQNKLSALPDGEDVDRFFDYLARKSQDALSLLQRIDEFLKSLGGAAEPQSDEKKTPTTPRLRNFPFGGSIPFAPLPDEFEIQGGGADLFERGAGGIAAASAAWREQAPVLREANAQYGELRQVFIELPEELERLSKHSRRLGAELAGALEEVLIKGESATEVLRALERQILGMLLNEFVTNPLKDMIGGIEGSVGGGVGQFLGGFLENALGGLTGFLGLAHGGAFRVGGSGGPDSRLVPLRLSPGELVEVTPPGPAPRRGPETVNLNIAVRVSPELGQRDGFGRTGRQMAEDLARQLVPVLRTL